MELHARVSFYCRVSLRHSEYAVREGTRPTALFFSGLVALERHSRLVWLARLGRCNSSSSACRC